VAVGGSVGAKVKVDVGAGDNVISGKVVTGVLQPAMLISKARKRIIFQT